ncbi:hypothetical protein [Xanthomonas phage Xp15]|uniref:Uncharacterized protein n=1 Tax=Xanthomonas phage Xp15 TaxID=322855 RepID=Q52PT6_9CAUD|nr:hypothetical protein XPXV15_gp75 [Xanthomonas phage Xp15]AAX84911.1 hypothetical protein [Xanthomonas phage Xp15]
MKRLSLIKNMHGDVVLTGVDEVEVSKLRYGLTHYGIDNIRPEGQALIVVVQSPSAEEIRAVRNIVARLYDTQMVDDHV